MKEIEKLKQWIEDSKKIVFLGGAGVSTESGIPDFRSASGLYKEKRLTRPEEILSHNFFFQHTREFYEFYKEKMIYLDAEPNETHKKLALLEQQGKLLGIVTQNIDGLHQKAGSKKVYEIHGTIHKNHCMKCGKEYPLETILEATDNYPLCSECGGLIKPDVVLYGEKLPDIPLTSSIEILNHADMLIIGGTSLSVAPACNLIYEFRGEHLIVINKSNPEQHMMLNKKSDLFIQKPLGEIFSQL